MIELVMLIIGTVIAGWITENLLNEVWKVITITFIVFSILLSVLIYYHRQKLIGKRVSILQQSILIDIDEKGGLNQLKTTTKLKNISRLLLSKYNHSLRADFPILQGVNIEVSDEEGPIEKEMIRETPHLKDFYVIFRHSLSFNQEYSYTWSCLGVPKFFDLNSLCTWEWTPLVFVSEIKIEIYHPLGFRVATSSFIDKNTGEQIAVPKTEFKQNRFITTVSLKNCSGGCYMLKWIYEKTYTISLNKF